MPTPHAAFALACCAPAALAAAQVTVTLFFDGGEAGVPAPGHETFSYGGATFESGSIHGAGSPGLRASDPYGWQPAIGFINSVITFSVPVSEVSFFYTHDDDNIFAGFASAYDAHGNLLATVASHAFTFPADPGNFVTLAGGGVEIAEIRFEAANGAFPGAGYVDNFSFVIVPAPATAGLLLPGLAAAARRRVRRA